MKSNCQGCSGQDWQGRRRGEVGSVVVVMVVGGGGQVCAGKEVKGSVLKIDDK